MPTGTGKWYSSAVIKAFNKEIDLSGTLDTIKAQLHTSAYTPDQDAHDYQNDLTNEVAAGGGYTTGGKTLTTVTFAYDSGTNTWKLDADDLVWSASTITARYLVLIDTTPGTSATNPLIGYIDFGTDVVSSSGNFTVQFDALGILNVVVS
jgi:hypothetical protein